MLKLLHPPAGDDVSLAQLALPNPEADTCVAWDNVAIVTEHMNRAQLRELQRQVCPELPLPYAEDDGN